MRAIKRDPKAAEYLIAGLVWFTAVFTKYGAARLCDHRAKNFPLDGR